MLITTPNYFINTDHVRSIQRHTNRTEITFHDAKVLAIHEKTDQENLWTELADGSFELSATNLTSSQKQK